MRFLIRYWIDQSVDRQIKLVGVIDRPTLREALAEYYDECGNMIKHTRATELEIREWGDSGLDFVVKLCPECLGNDEHCMHCGGDGVAPDSGEVAEPERPEFPVYYDSQGREHQEF